MRASVLALVMAVLSVQAGAWAAPQIIEDVPSYTWYHGCGPTVAGMIMGYWDGLGFDSLIDGSNDWASNRQAIEDMIASPGHIQDYVPTPDRQPTAEVLVHENDCVADFMAASRYPLGYGQSFVSMQYKGMADYACSRGYANATGNIVGYDQLWDTFMDEIDASRPMEFYVDTSGNGRANHFVTAVGYDNSPDGPRYAAYNTYDHIMRWYDFAPAQTGCEYGVKSGVWFCLGEPTIDSETPGDFDGDEIVGVADIEQMGRAILAHATDPVFDLNEDGYTDWGDLRMLVTELVFVNGDPSVTGTMFGDADLDGEVDLQDFVLLKSNFQLGDGCWSSGDFDVDGDVDLQDFSTLVTTFGYKKMNGASVPEPATGILIAVGAAAGLRRRRRRL